MTFRAEVRKMGLTITISSDRKHGNGTKGGGRKNTTGKKAVVKKDGAEEKPIRGSTTTDVLRQVREKYKIPHHVQINRKGETRI